MTSLFKPFTAALLLAATASAASAQDIRPGPNSPEVTEELDLNVTSEWMTSYIRDGVAPSNVRVSVDPISRGQAIWFDTTVEFILDEADRKPLYDRLFRIGYANTSITENGVSYLTNSSTDLQLRTLTTSDVKETRFIPHDCTRVLGECAFEKRVKKQSLFYLRTSSFADGIWRDTLAYDPARDPKGRSDVVEESVFSVDAAGVIIDSEVTRFARSGKSLTRMTRIDLGKVKEPQKALPPALILPEGSYFSFSRTCSQTDRAGEVADVRQALTADDRWTTANDADATIHVYCGPSEPAKSLCHQPGHVIFMTNEGRIGFGCYEGAAPKG